MGKVNRFRKHRVEVCFTNEEYDLLTFKAETTKRSVSTVIRELIIYGSIDAKWLDEKSLKAVLEMNELLEKQTQNVIEIGNNINQIAYNCNSKYEATEIEMKQALRQLQEIYYLYMKCIEDIRDFYEINAVSIPRELDK